VPPAAPGRTVGTSTAVAERRRIVAMGGGGYSMEPDNPLLDRFVVELARRRRGRRRPTVCYLGTAGGEQERFSELFSRAYAELHCRPVELSLFWREVQDLRGFLLDCDAVLVGGGNTANLLVIWRLHGLDEALRAAWEDDVVLAGWSAGMLCWFESGVTDSFDVGRLAPLHDGLGFLPGSACPHYDGGPQRRPTYRRLVGDGTLPAGYAADDGAALVFRGTALAEVVTSRPGARAFRVERRDGGLAETPLATRLLGTTPG
jgi:dipeptidase E